MNVSVCVGVSVPADIPVIAVGKLVDIFPYACNACCELRFYSYDGKFF